MAKQKLGQHFLFDKNILKKIALEAGLSKAENILEIGPGMGTLTEQLLQLFNKVYAVELDRYFYHYMLEKFSAFKHLYVINDDILKVNIESLPVTAATGNIPYYITTPIIFKLLEAKNIDYFSLLMQAEVAKRITANCGSGDYGILSINVQFQADVKIAFRVKKSSFSPPPKVDSAVVTFKKRKVPEKTIKYLKKLTQMAFGMRRKTLFNNLKGLLGEETAAFIKQFGISQNMRAEELPIDMFIKMAEELQKRGL